MNKKELYQVWKKNYFLDDFLIEKIILKNTKLSKSNLFLLEEINEDLENIFLDFQKFKEWIPIEYILWHAEFYSLDFFVDNRVLIPRNDTEVMVIESLKEIKKLDNFTLIDVWTWSSCIPISILKNTSNKPKNTYVVDISEKALEVSKINLTKHFLENEVMQLESNLLSIFLEKEFFLEKHLIITANLPYIKNEDLDNMDDWVFFFEPNIALFWWKETWFELYEKLISQIFELKSFCKIEKILLFIEIWFDQWEFSKKYLNNLWLKFEFFKDLWWIERMIKIEF
jgi:release factor glutamine methyltransferase